MPKRKRQAKIPTPAWEPPRGALGRRILGRTPKFYATVGIVALIVAAIAVVGFAYWADYRADQQRPGSTAVQVGDTKYSLRYFTERLRTFVQQAGGPANQAAAPSVAIPTVTEILVAEAVVLRFAEEQAVTASDDEINSEIATRLGLSAGDPNFDARYQDDLLRSGLTEEEYRLMIRAGVLTKKLRDNFQSAVPQSAESIHYRQILVAEQAEADDIRKKVETGEDFAELAKSSLDTTGRDNGGDVGWVPRGLLDKTLEDRLFDLEPNGVITFPTSSGVYVFQVVEKEKDRAIDTDKRPTLAERMLSDWIEEKKAGLEVKEPVTEDTDKARWAVDRAYSPTT